MTKRRQQRSERPAVAAPRVTAPSPLLLHFAAAAVALLCVAMAWASRGNLNVDGVSYFDLAHRLAAGDLKGFVQGYWSPAYPTILAMLLSLFGLSGSAAVSAAHALNLIIALVTVWVLWREAHRRGAVVWGVLVLTAFLMASARTVRIDAVTPDLLLLLALTCVGLELSRPGGWRPARLGLLTGLAFLSKTSIWPWMAVASVIGIIALRTQPLLRRALLISVAITAIPVALWTAAVSIDEGRPTLGSTGKLGACWYLLSCDGRTPDSHRGEHRQYHDWQLGAEYRAKVAIFSDSTWTYAPWSDPSAWQRDMVSQESIRPTLMHFFIYVSKQLGLVVGIWMAGLFLLALLPALAMTRDAPGLQETFRSVPGWLMGLGILGILQFTAVHAEPRLIAPFVMLFALGWLEWRLRGTPRVPMPAVATGGLVVAIAIGAWHLVDQSRVTASAEMRTAQLEPSHPAFLAPHRVAVVGPALSMMPDLYRAHAHVVVQIMTPGPDALLAWPGEAQAALAARLSALGVKELWISQGREGFRIAPLAQGNRPAAR